MNIFQVPVEFVGRAWADGAHTLSKAADKAAGEITTDQLKMILMRGERALLGISDGEKTAVWMAVGVDQLPNVRTLFVYSIAGEATAEAFSCLAAYAKAAGCTEIRGACSDSVLRLWRKFEAEKVYNVFRICI